MEKLLYSPELRPSYNRKSPEFRMKHALWVSSLISYVLNAAFFR